MTTQLYNPNDGLAGRDGGPYLDEVEAETAEIRRAKIEGREPDLKNPGATAGIPLVTGPQLVQTANVNVPSKPETFDGKVLEAFASVVSKEKPKVPTDTTHNITDERPEIQEKGFVSQDPFRTELKEDPKSEAKSSSTSSTSGSSK